MADITMCCAESCTYENECYRKTAKADVNQSYSDYSYTCTAENGFNSYIQDTNMHT